MKILRFAFFFLLCASLFLLSPSAEEITVPKEFSDYLSALPEELLKELPEEFFSENPGELEKGLTAILTPSGVFSLLSALFGNAWETCVATFLSVLGVLILSAVLQRLRDTAGSRELHQAVSLCSVLAILTLLLTLGYRETLRVTEILQSVHHATSLSLPLLSALYLVGGNVSTAVTASAGLSVCLTVTEELVANSVLPFVALSLVLSVMGSITPFRTKLLSDTLKKNYTVFLSLLMVILLAMLSAQTLLSARTDSVSAKGLKFAASSLIPVVGGSVSELLFSVSSGISYLRGVVGICGILLLILTLLPGVVSLLLHRLLWQVLSAVADLFSCDVEKQLLGELSSLCGYLLTSVLICSSAPILSLSLLISCASAWG